MITPIRQARERAGFSQVEAARRLKMAPSQLSNYERGLPFGPAVRKRLERVLGALDA
jgi:transcriptional regulator with XRE-family HTH domain